MENHQSGDRPTRATYDSYWLLAGLQHPAYTKFKHRPVKQNSKANFDEVKKCLGEALIDHHTHYERLVDTLGALGYKKSSQAIKRQLPKGPKTRKGNFGEVVATEHLLQRYRYEIPIFKLRFRDAYDLPMRGEDILGWISNAKGQIKKLCVGEAKTAARFSSRTVLNAHKRLMKTYRPRPETLSLLAEILYASGNNRLGQEVDRIFRQMALSRIPQDNWIFLITEKEASDPFAAIQALAKIAPNLHCVDLRIERLTDFVNDLFDNPRIPRGNGNGS